jgi:hypothetical protein
MNLQHERKRNTEAESTFTILEIGYMWCVDICIHNLFFPKIKVYIGNFVIEFEI